MKKIILTESDKKVIISAKEKAIIESFAKTFNKIKRIDENEINEDLTLQYADRPTATSPILEIGYDDDGILYKFGFNFREDEEIPLSELISGIQKANQGLQNVIQGGSDLGAFDFQREIKLLQKLAEFAKQSKMDNNNVVMLKSNMNHPNQEWTDKEDRAMDDYHDQMNKRDDYDSYKYTNGLSEESDEIENDETIYVDNDLSDYFDIPYQNDGEQTVINTGALRNNSRRSWDSKHLAIFDKYAGKDLLLKGKGFGWWEIVRAH